MAMDDISSLLKDFDITALIPDLQTVLGKLDLLLRLLVMAGPLTLLGLGLYYFLFPPKEANYEAGYRFRYAMSKVKVWQFTQRLAGMVFSTLGLGLTVVMSLICSSFSGLAAPDMVARAATCILWEIGLLLAATLAVNITVMCLYDSKGNPRKKAE